MNRLRAGAGGAAVAALMAWGAACRSAPEPAPPLPPPEPEARIPDWVRRTPSPRGEVCAVGAVDRTFYVQDAHARAAEAARVELAKTIEVRVNSVMYDYQSTRGSWVHSADVVKVVESVTDGVVHGAEVRATWRDVDGLHLAPGMTFALACLRTDVPVAQLAEALRVAGETDAADVEGVRLRAQAAFDELEAHEAERVSGPKSDDEVNVPEGASVPGPEEVP